MWYKFWRVFTAGPQHVVLILLFFLFYSGTLARSINFGGNPNTWLETVGLAEYKANFRRNHIKTVRDMEAYLLEITIDIHTYTFKNYDKR